MLDGATPRSFYGQGTSAVDLHAFQEATAMREGLAEETQGLLKGVEKILEYPYPRFSPHPLPYHPLDENP